MMGRCRKNSGSTTTCFYYDLLGVPVLEYRSGSIYAINTFGPSGLISRGTSSTNEIYYQFDERGNTITRSNNVGTVSGYHGSDTYGVQFAGESSTDPFLGFGAQWGYYRDSEIAFLLLGHRIYDPGYARFLNRDPIGLAGGINTYEYSLNNPANRTDSSGLQSAGGDDPLLNNVGIGLFPDPNTIYVYGDDTDPDIQSASAWGFIAFGPDNPNPLYHQPDRGALANLLLDAPAGTTFYFWGHNAGKAGSIKLNHGCGRRSLQLPDIAYIAGQRQRRHLGKLGAIILNACDSVMTAGAVNTWLTLGSSVTGYAGLTFDPSAMKWSPPLSFTTPINYNPGLNGGGH